MAGRAKDNHQPLRLNYESFRSELSLSLRPDPLLCYLRGNNDWVYNHACRLSHNPYPYYKKHQKLSTTSFLAKFLEQGYVMQINHIHKDKCII